MTEEQAVTLKHFCKDAHKLQVTVLRAAEVGVFEIRFTDFDDDGGIVYYTVLVPETED